MKIATTAALSVTVGVAVLVAREVTVPLVEAVEDCAPDCEVAGPAAAMPEVAVLVGGVAAATLIFVLLARIRGKRGESV